SARTAASRGACASARTRSGFSASIAARTPVPRKRMYACSTAPRAFRRGVKQASASMPAANGARSRTRTAWPRWPSARAQCGAFGEPLTLRLGPARGLAARVVAAVEEDVVGRERRLAARCRFERQRRGCADLGRELRIERAQVLLEVSGHVEGRSAVQAPCQRQCAVSGRTWPL